MAKIDTLLRAVLKHDMDALKLESGSLPRLAKGDQEHGVTKTQLDRATIDSLLEEIYPTGIVPTPESISHLDFNYSVDGKSFLILAESSPAGWTVRARPGGSPAATAAPADLLGDIATDSSLGEISTDLDSSGVDLTDSAPAEPFQSQPQATQAAAAEPAPTPVTPAAGPPVSASQVMTPAAGSGAEVPGVPELLRELIERGGSDLHLSASQVPRMRVHGELVKLPYAPAESDRLWDLLAPLAPERNREEFQETNDTDFAFEITGVARFRMNMFRDRLGVGLVARQIPHEIPTAEQLGLPDSLKKLAYLSKGLVLVTGPTGSGKSTTLAAIVDVVNRARKDHIITIEDPVEFVHPSRGCLVNQREINVHTTSFKKALRAALREDPDIVLVGEMRDLETISIAIETAETGHLVFGTLHTTTAPSTIERVVDQFPGDRQGQIRMMLADSLKAVIAQTLLRRKAGGRVAAYEILLGTPAIANLIREGKTFQIQSAMQTGRGLGMALLNDALSDLVEKDVVEAREAYIKAIDKDGLMRRFAAANIDFDPEGLTS